jgi:CHAT domain-containing protein
MKADRIRKPVVCGLLLSLWLGLLGHRAAATATAVATPTDSAQMWLQRGCEAQARHDRTAAFMAFGRAARAPGLTGWASRLAQSQLLLTLDAPTAAQVQLERVPIISAQTEPWAAVARELTVARQARGSLEPAVCLQAARRANQLLQRLTKSNDLRRLHGLLALSSALQMNGKTDSALVYATRALRLIHLKTAVQPAQPLWLQAVLPQMLPPYVYVQLSAVMFILGKQEPSERVAEFEGRAFGSWLAAANVYLDSAFVKSGRGETIDSVETATIWRQRGLFAAELAASDDSPAGDAAGVRAARYLNQALALERRPSMLAITYCLRGELHATFGETEAALLDFQRALALLLPATDTRAVISLPPALEDAAGYHALRYILEQKAAAFRDLYTETHQPRYLEAFCAHALALADVLAYRRRQASLGQETSETANESGQLRDNYSLAIEATQARYQAYQRPADLEAAFRITENAKAWRLLTRVGGERPEVVLRADRQLLRTFRKRSMAGRRWQELLKLIAQYPALRQTPALRHVADSARTAEQQLAALTRQLRANYPELYAQAFGGNYALSLEKAQAALPADGRTAAVEFLRRTSYEDGNHQEWLYAFVVQRSGTRLLRLALPTAFPDSVNALAQALARAGSRRYPSLAAQVYQQVLAPVVATLATGTQRLIIAPDGELWRVPFEALLTDSSSNPTSSQVTIPYQRLPYVLRKWHITYAHSLTLRANSIASAPPTSHDAQILGMAPFAPPLVALTDPQALPFSAQLLTALAAKMAGEFTIGPNASAKTFRAQAAQYEILHLATHAAPDLADPRASRILLADRPLTLAELFGLRLRPQLVVLSACETGVGKLAEPSEGLTSLSWGFTFAGAASTVATLWRVDDRATANLLTDFYAALRQGHAKDDALHDAKLAALRTAGPTAADPFYWSGMVLTGDERPLQIAPSGQPLSFWLMIGGGVLTGFLGWSWWARRRKGKQG